MLNYEHRKTIDALRKDGYALIVLSPEELDGVDPKLVEGALKNVFQFIQGLGASNVHPDNQD